jgi:hypothetical protein
VHNAIIKESHSELTLIPVGVVVRKGYAKNKIQILK